VQHRILGSIFASSNPSDHPRILSIRFLEGLGEIIGWKKESIIGIVLTPNYDLTLLDAPAGHLPGAAWLMALHENALDACRGRKCVSRAKASEAIPNFGLCN